MREAKVVISLSTSLKNHKLLNVAFNVEKSAQNTPCDPLRTPPKATKGCPKPTTNRMTELVHTDTRKRPAKTGPSPNLAAWAQPGNPKCGCPATPKVWISLNTSSENVLTTLIPTARGPNAPKKAKKLKKSSAGGPLETPMRTLKTPFGLNLAPNRTLLEQEHAHTTEETTSFAFGVCQGPLERAKSSDFGKDIL